MNEIKIGDCREIMRTWIAEGVKAQMCVTSPPYWGLRDYGTATWEGGDAECDHLRVNDQRDPTITKQTQNAGTSTLGYADVCGKCGARRVDSQLGIEKTPQEFVSNMVSVFRLVWDVLADDGVLWLNMGDCYAGSGMTGGTNSKEGQAGRAARMFSGNRREGAALPPGTKPKDLCGIPWRLAFALQDDGWYLRQDIIWSKPNPMPESVRDRCTKAHEYLFMLTKRERYYYDQDAIKEPLALSSIDRLSQDVENQQGSDRVPGKTNGAMKAVRKSGNLERKPSAARGVPEDGNGDLAGSIPWEGSTRNKRSVWTVAPQPYSESHFATFPPALIEPCILAGSRVGDIVLDPFMGSGTTAQVAIKLGRKYLGCELNPEYAKLQEDRTRQSAMPL